MREIRVYPNPYHAIDGRGEPQCAVPFPRNPDRYIGARVDQARSLAFAKQRLAMAGLHPQHDFDERTGVPALFVYDCDEKGLAPVAVAFTAELSGYIARQINDGALIAADEQSARMVGISNFVEPLKQLESEKLEACHYILATLGVKPAAILEEGCNHELAPAWAKAGLEYFLPPKPEATEPKAAAQSASEDAEAVIPPAPETAPGGAEAPANQTTTTGREGLVTTLQARAGAAGKGDD